LALLAGGAATLVWLAPLRADPGRGERIFQRCFACHSVVAGDDRLPGPSLRGVVGRRAGSLPGFRYSPALVDAGARGLADPQAFVPGTEMGLPPLRAADDRRDVIDFLERRTP
jgi:cytochrome c